MRSKIKAKRSKGLRRGRTARGAGVGRMSSEQSQWEHR